MNYVEETDKLQAILSEVGRIPVDELHAMYDAKQVIEWHGGVVELDTPEKIESHRSAIDKFATVDGIMAQVMEAADLYNPHFMVFYFDSKLKLSKAGFTLHADAKVPAKVMDAREFLATVDGYTPYEFDQRDVSEVTKELRAQNLAGAVARGATGIVSGAIGHEFHTKVRAVIHGWYGNDPSYKLDIIANLCADATQAYTDRA